MDLSRPTRSSHYPRTQLRSESVGSFSHRIMDVFYKHSDRVLLEDDNVRLTGKECRQTFMNLKRSIELNVPPRGRVAVVCPNSVAQALAIFSVILSGRVPVILNHKIRRDELKKHWEQLNLHGAIIISHLELDLPMDISTFRISPEGELLTIYGDPTYLMNPFPHPETALILYTSGSSGEPKGVEISGQGLLYVIDTLIQRFNLDENTISPVNLPLYHTMGLNTHFFPTFFAGGKSVFFHTRSKINYGRCFKNILACKGTYVSLITDILRLCHEEKNHENLPPAEHVKHVQLAGGMIQREHLDMARELFPRAILHKGYGLTEAIRVSMLSSEDEFFLTESSGKVLAGQDVRIKHPSSGRILPAGVMGEVFVKGPNVMIRYEDGHNPFDAEGYLGTGDLGFLTHHNHLVIQGRKDSVFKSRGRRVSALEIENIAREVSGVYEAKCLPLKTRRGLVPVLFVSFEETFKDQEILERHLKSQLESYKLPREIVVLPSLPRTDHGKISQPKLLELWDEIRGHNTIKVAPAAIAEIQEGAQS